MINNFLQVILIILIFCFLDLCKTDINFDLSCPILENYSSIDNYIVLSYKIAFFFNLVCFDLIQALIKMYFECTILLFRFE